MTDTPRTSSLEKKYMYVTEARPLEMAKALDDMFCQYAELERENMKLKRENAAIRADLHNLAIKFKLEESTKIDLFDTVLACLSVAYGDRNVPVEELEKVVKSTSKKPSEYIEKVITDLKNEINDLKKMGRATIGDTRKEKTD